MFLNREFEWLKFNERVFNLAVDHTIPLLERVNFYNIYHNNLDEFFMKRVGGLKRQVYSSVSFLSLDGLTSEEQLEVIRDEVLSFEKSLAKSFRKSLVPELEKHNISFVKWNELEEEEKKTAYEYFRKKIFPILTPMAVDQGHPFPLISNLSLSLAVSLQHSEDDDLLFARIKMPKLSPKWLQFSSEKNPKKLRFVSIIEVIQAFIADVFPEMKILNTLPFRITRNIDISNLEDEDVEDLLETITEEVKLRKFADVVRLEVPENADPWLLDFLTQELEILEPDIYESKYDLCYKDLSSIYKLPLPNLKHPPWFPLTNHRLREDLNIFDSIKKGDILVHHPYDSFSTSVDRFISNAAEDPNVITIKMTLYRTSEDSTIIASLIRAAERGKHVVCLVEIKARLEEERNIHWAQKLENAGAHVVYGIIGLKTHCKIALIIRKENDDFVPYAHIGTGNYNGNTAKLYEDFGLFIRGNSITDEMIELFNYLTGRSKKKDFKHLLIAPINLKQTILDSIQEEMANAKNKKPAFIYAKCNGLEDPDIIEALYDASRAGVKIKMIIRGFSCLLPGVKGMSENIEIISVLGRFLEHSRIYWFQNGQQNLINGKVYIGSADLMRRNLRGRIEVMVPIENLRHKQEILDFLDDLWACKKSSWELRKDGEYYPRDQVKNNPKNSDPRSNQDAHSYLMAKFKKNHEEAQNIDRELNKL